MVSKNCAAAGLVCRLMVVMLGAVMMTLRISADPDMLQDICVADYQSPLKVNGYACKSKPPTSNDFFFGGLANPARTGNATVTPANVKKIPGLNTLGISLARVDFVPGGVNPPHTHPRATEIVFVLNGELDVGFVTTENVLISRTIKTGEVFVFPKGLLHYQRNPAAKNPATAIAAFSSQLPGTLSIAAALFPAVPDAVLADAFKIDTKEVQSIKKNFPTNKK